MSLENKDVTASNVMNDGSPIPAPTSGARDSKPTMTELQLRKQTILSKLFAAISSVVNEEYDETIELLIAGGVVAKQLKIDKERSLRKTPAEAASINPDNCYAHESFPGFAWTLIKDDNTFYPLFLGMDDKNVLTKRLHVKELSLADSQAMYNRFKLEVELNKAGADFA